MKITLTQRQMDLRRCFRKSCIKHWPDHSKYLMFTMYHDVMDEFNITLDEAIKEMQVIPSIGFIHPKWSIPAWLASNFPFTSGALWDGKTGIAVMNIWAKEPRSKSKSVLSEASHTYTARKKLRALGELKANMPDRWGGTDWHKVK